MSVSPVPTSAFHILPLSSLRESSWNPRKHYDESKLDELAKSITEKGIIEPLVVRPLGPHDGSDGPVEILAGSRRFRAATRAGLAEVPVVVRHIDDVAALELAVIENSQREDVDPLDEAEGYQALLKLGGKKNGYNVAVVAGKVGKSESFVYRRLKLLELEPALKDALAEDRLSIAHAERLCRLTPALRKEASDPEKGVVWRHSPLLSYSEKWTPQRDDLRPLSELEHFIRTRHHFDPAARDTRHFQEELAEQIDAAVGVAEAAASGDLGKAMDADNAIASLVSLSVDPMVRMRLRANPNDPIPLSPSKWREVTSGKDQCPHVVKGAITHGGPARILDVCMKKSCQKHFPVAKKAKASKAKASAAPVRDRWQEEEDRRRREREAWNAMIKLAAPAFAAHVAEVKFSAALARHVMSSYDVRTVREVFGVDLTEKTAAQALLLSGVSTHSESEFAAQAKTWGFDFKAWKKGYDAEVKAAGKAALDTQREQLAGKGKKTAKKPAAKKGRK